MEVWRTFIASRCRKLPARFQRPCGVPDRRARASGRCQASGSMRPRRTERRMTGWRHRAGVAGCGWPGVPRSSWRSRPAYVMSDPGPACESCRFWERIWSAWAISRALGAGGMPATMARMTSLSDNARSSLLMGSTSRGVCNGKSAAAPCGERCGFGR